MYNYLTTEKCNNDDKLKKLRYEIRKATIKMIAEKIKLLSEYLEQK